MTRNLKAENALLRKEQKRLEDEVKTVRALLEEERRLRAYEIGGVNARLRRSQLRTQVLGDTASAALAALELNNAETASLLLVSMRRVYVNGLRDQVACEPGGVAWSVVQSGEETGK